MGGLIPAIAILAALVVIPLGIVALIYLVVPVCRGIAWLVSRVFKFTFGEVSDILRFIGAAVTFLVFVPLVIGNIIIGRWSAAGHFGRAIQSECYTIGRCVYRIVVGHPARLLCLTSLVEGIEHRVPAAVAAAPGADAPRGMGDKFGGSGGGGGGGRTGQFDGYRIVGSLPGGGSGSKLYIAAPNAQRLAAFARNGQADVGEVVIKSFSLRDGSTLPQIVRESRALDAAKRLGLILEHDLTPERFYYVMRYVPGESLGLVTQRLHGAGEGNGLGRRELAQALDYAADLLRTLTHYHSGGLWHKDVKPDNIIISRDGRAHLVDFGLVTPLRSAMTLTTHGTEYFRDPEMVRMALKGVKVQDVDGTKFDVYAAGAVLYSIIENSFPAHGGLSQISKSCPEALRWIVRRAMTDYDKRYESAAAMLADIDAVASSADPFAMLPVALPSVRGGEENEPPVELERDIAGAAPIGAAAVPSPAHVASFAAALPVPPPPPPPPAAPDRSHIRVTNWWTGRYAVVRPAAAPPVGGMHAPAPAPAPFRRHESGRTAAEQLRHARERAAAARARAQERMRTRGRSPVYASAADQSGVNGGIAMALAAFIGLCALIGVGVYGLSYRSVPAGAPDHAQADLSADGSLASVRLVDGVPDAAAPTDHAADWDLVADDQAAAPQGQVLVIRDSFTLSPDLIGRVNSALARLGKAGFDLIGNVARTGEGSGGSAADADTQIEMAAELRNELGLLPFRSPDAQTVIQAWLAIHDEVSLVTWIGTGDEGQPIAWIVGRDRDAKPTVSRAIAALTGR